ncbi:hypothetical protein AABB24_023447, partial [Solanum stoloniferum]
FPPLLSLDQPLFPLRRPSPFFRQAPTPSLFLFPILSSSPLSRPPPLSLGVADATGSSTRRAAGEGLRQVAFPPLFSLSLFRPDATGKKPPATRREEQIGGTSSQ